MKFCLLGILALTLQAQTSVKPEQIRAQPAPAVRLLAFDSTGRLMLLDLGPGVQIVGSMVTAAVDASPPVIVSTRLKRDASGNYPATVGLVTRNGVVQERGGDYNLTSAGLVPVTPWDAADIVLAITAERAPALLRAVP
jgi:hypothetical protein